MNAPIAERRKVAERAILVEEALSKLRHALRNQHATIRNAVFFLQRKLSPNKISEDEPLGARAAIISRVHARHPGVVSVKTRIGGERVLPMLSGEQLPRIC